MKRTIIGGLLFSSGALICLVILILAALHVPSITAWRGSKLWFAIFGTNEPMGNNEVNSLFLGFPFIVGIVLFILGFIVLVVEYFKKD
ncbi:hypothetical protein [Paenibacillus spongiae]|uniref:Uncharacterized protein n=1 Tax=Paenibacillus spongiae TaxID=2909671 RepID=A0ABY5S6D5_9BACL|nr:hypothetical protein [Paenibacillus spongiae]UVI29269.1 hypothetical protein L1F29_28185 [Paenibacillus spongiae]